MQDNFAFSVIERKKALKWQDRSSWLKNRLIGIGYRGQAFGAIQEKNHEI